MQEKSLIKKNILQYIKYKLITSYKFYKETGITRGILEQNNGMSEENTARFLDYYSDVNPIWLLTGKGDMLLSGPIDVGLEKKEVSAAPAVEECRACEALERVIAAKEEQIRALREIIEAKDEIISNLKTQPAGKPHPAHCATEKIQQPG